MPEEYETYLDRERARLDELNRKRVEQVVFVVLVCAVGFLLGLMANHF